MSLQESINDRRGFFQEKLFPFLRDEAGPRIFCQGGVRSAYNPVSD